MYKVLTVRFDILLRQLFMFYQNIATITFRLYDLIKNKMMMAMNNNLLWNKYYRILVQYPEDYLAEFENGRAYEARDIHRPYSEQVFSEKSEDLCAKFLYARHL